MAVRYIGFSNETLRKLPDLGPVAQCPNCGRECPVESSGPLQFIKCCNIYLVGVNGKDISAQPADTSGKVDL